MPAAIAVQQPSDLGRARANSFAIPLHYSCRTSPRHPGCGGARHPLWFVNGPLQDSHAHTVSSREPRCSLIYRLALQMRDRHAKLPMSVADSMSLTMLEVQRRLV